MNANVGTFLGKTKYFFQVVLPYWYVGKSSHQLMGWLSNFKEFCELVIKQSLLKIKIYQLKIKHYIKTNCNKYLKPISS